MKAALGFIGQDEAFSPDLPPRRIIPAADPNEVMRDQLEYVIEHTQSHAAGGARGEKCSVCKLYFEVCTLLLEVFRETKPALSARS